MIYLAVMTSIFAALFLTLSLKILSLFHFIKWSPVGYTKEWGILVHNHWTIKWLFLIIIIFLISLIFYFIMQYVALVPPFITSLIIGVVLALIVEWVIFDLPAELSSFKKLSIPFMVVVVVTARFVFETAAYHYKAHGERNKLPYKDSMIK
mgnify:FL=1